MICEGLKGLPADALAEIAGFVCLVRKRLLQPEVYEEELRDLLIRAELKQLSHESQAHLEEEFEGYDQR